MTGTPIFVPKGGGQGRCRPGVTCGPAGSAGPRRASGRPAPRSARDRSNRPVLARARIEAKDDPPATPRIRSEMHPQWCVVPPSTLEDRRIRCRRDRCRGSGRGVRSSSSCAAIRTIEGASLVPSVAGGHALSWARQRLGEPASGRALVSPRSRPWRSARPRDILLRRRGPRRGKGSCGNGSLADVRRPPVTARWRSRTADVFAGQAPRGRMARRPGRRRKGMPR